MAATICRREKNIVVEDDDGYEICSDIELELFCKRKDDPCFVITTTLDADNENKIVALSNSPTRLVTASVVEENGDPLVFAHRSVAVNEAEMDVTSEDVIYFENMDEDIVTAPWLFPLSLFSVSPPVGPHVKFSFVCV